MFRPSVVVAGLLLALPPAPNDGQAMAGSAPATECAVLPLASGPQRILDDMTLPHEGRPSGVLDGAGWEHEPRVGYGNVPPPGWDAALAWGQVYTDGKGDTSINTRFQIRNLQLWYLSKSDDTWKLWSRASRVDGGNYAEDFQNDVSREADIRSERGNGGGISATLIDGFNFHFWDGGGRTRIDPDDIGGVWVSLESRLIKDDPGGPDDRDSARLMMSAGADYWQDTAAQWDRWTTNGDIFIGRFRYLTPKWQSFHGHTLTAAQLRSNPPPFD